MRDYIYLFNFNEFAIIFDGQKTMNLQIPLNHFIHLYYLGLNDINC